MSVPIIPAIIPHSESEVIALAAELAFSRELHLDVVDGDFVTTVSWPYNPKGNPAHVSPTTDAFTLEVDLMVRDSVAAARAWEAAGADMIIFHVETISLEAFTGFCHRSKATIGISFHGETTLSAVMPYIAIADYVQVMGIEHIGAQGQPFSERTFEKITAIQSAYPTKLISVDGGVNAKTIPRLIKAGVGRLIVGSAIIGQENKKAAYDALVAGVNEHA